MNAPRPPLPRALSLSTAIVKHCRCGREYTAAEWQELEDVGLIAPVSKQPPIELRKCKCGATIGVELETPSEKRSG